MFGWSQCNLVVNSPFTPDYILCRAIYTTRVFYVEEGAGSPHSMLSKRIDLLAVGRYRSLQAFPSWRSIRRRFPEVMSKAEVVRYRPYLTDGKTR